MKRAKIILLLTLSLVTISNLWANDKILIVITNNKEVNATIQGRDTTIAGGYELSEVSQAYEVFTKSGFDVDFMSPNGGMTYPEPEEKMNDLNKKFISNPSIKSRLDNTLSPKDVKSGDYVAIYFAGGKVLWDFPDSKSLAKLTAKIYESDGVVGAVCHGPAALVNVRLSDGSLLIKGRKVSGFTNNEEQLFSKTSKFLPFQLQSKLTDLGADFQEAPPMFDQAVVDGRLVTGQNPLSTYSVAEKMVIALGKTPPQRPWDKLSFTLEVIKLAYWENPEQAKDFYNEHISNELVMDEQLFQDYGAYGFMGYFGEEIKKQSPTLLKLATEIYPNSPRSHEELAKAYFQLGKKAEALASVESCLKLDPSSKSALELKSKIGK